MKSVVRRRNSMFPGFSRMFDDFFNTEMVDWSNNNFSSTNTTLPAVNIKETEDEFTVQVAAPGMEKKDFTIEVNDGNLVIASQREYRNEEKDGERFTKREFSYQSFQRSFILPDSVDQEKIKAKYNEGILHVHIPKKAEAKPKPAKLIEVG